MKLEAAEEEPPVKQSIFPQEPLQPKEAAVNPTMETSNRLIEMEKIDVAKLDEDYSKTSHHFPNIPLIIADIVVILVMFYSIGRTRYTVCRCFWVYFLSWYYSLLPHTLELTL